MLRLIIANKRYSSWSMRPWLVLKHFELSFEETLIPLRQEDTATQIRQYSPSGKVPTLIDGHNVIWDSISIIEYLHEMNPTLGIWPAEPSARAHARSISAEMHSGFPHLRLQCPMNLAKRYARIERGEGVNAEVARICHIFHDTRGRFGGMGPYLYGAFSAADAMYAPIVARLHTYSIKVDPVSQAYMEAILADPSVVAWWQAALQEAWFIEDYQKDEPVIEDHHLKM